MRYILKRVIIGILIGLGIMFFKNNISFAATATDVYWSSNQINGQNVSTGTILWFNANQSYNWTINNLGCSYSVNDYPEACGNGNCKLYVDLYFSTNMPFSNWVDTTNGYSWNQVRLGNKIMYNDFSTGYFVKRFIFTPNQYAHTDEYTVTFSRSGSLSTGTVSGANYGQAWKLQSYKCGLTSEMEQLPTDDPQYTQINNIQNVVNGINVGITQIGNFAQQLIEATQQMEETMKDDSIEQNNPQFDEFDDYVANNGVITNLITMPVTLFTKVLNTLNGSCATYNLGSLYGTDLTLPCINVSNYLGSALWGVIDVIISGLLVYAISRHFIKVFNKMSSLEESDIID